MVSATFENDLDEMSKRWELLKLINGCVLWPDVIPQRDHLVTRDTGN